MVKEDYKFDQKLFLHSAGIDATLTDCIFGDNCLKKNPHRLPFLSRLFFVDKKFLAR